MIIGTITALMILFGGGIDSPYIIPEADKLVLAEISDKERKAEVKDKIKTYKTTWKSFKKWEKGFQKEYKKASADINTSNEDLLERIEEYVVKQQALDANLYPIRLDIMNSMTDEEWTSMIDNAILVPEKKAAKKDKKQIKAELKQSEKLLDFREDVMSSLDENADADAVNKALDEFENQLGDLTYQEQNLFISIIESVGNKNTSYDELIDISDSYLEYRVELSKAYIQLRAKLLANTNADNWDKVHKQLIKLM